MALLWVPNIIWPITLGVPKKDHNVGNIPYRQKQGLFRVSGFAGAEGIRRLPVTLMAENLCSLREERPAFRPDGRIWVTSEP